MGWSSCNFLALGSCSSCLRLPQLNLPVDQGAHILLLSVIVWSGRHDVLDTIKSDIWPNNNEQKRWEVSLGGPPAAEREVLLWTWKIVTCGIWCDTSSGNQQLQNGRRQPDHQRTNSRWRWCKEIHRRRQLWYGQLITTIITNNYFTTTTMTPLRIILATLSLAVGSHAFTSTSLPPRILCTSSKTCVAATPMQSSVGNLHGQGSCFLPLLQNDDEYIAPRIVQVSYILCLVNYIYIGVYRFDGSDHA